MAYLSVGAVESALASLETAYPGTCELITLPNATVEGRTQHAVRIGTQPASTRDCVLFTSSVHAREWGGADICVNFAADLLEAYSLGTGLTYGSKSFSSAQIQSIVQDLNVIVFACVNPDGRHYSQNTFPMWRRNRNPAPSGGDPNKIGVDLNRNYDFLWDYKNLFAPYAYDPSNWYQLSVSDTPGSEVYHGQAPFSEAETQNVKWLMDNYARIKWFVDIHSSGRLVLYNWGHDNNQTTDPGMNFLNPAYDSSRGILGDTAYNEYIPPCDLAGSQALGDVLKGAIKAVRNINYTVEQSVGLYPTCGTGPDYAYSRYFADTTKSRIIGFTIEWGTQFMPQWSEMEEIIKDINSGMLAFCLDAPCQGNAVCATLQTNALNFVDIPESETTFRAVVFSVRSCLNATFEIISGPTVLSGPPTTNFGTPLGTTFTSPTNNDFNTPRDALLWISYTGTSDGDAATGIVTVRCVETSEEWTIPITANTVSRPSVAVVLALDKSGSMGSASGIPGYDRMDVLHFSAPPFVTVIQEGNAIGLVAFDHNANTILPVTGPLGPAATDIFDRPAANVAINAHNTNPAGYTSIGDALELAHNMLAPVTGYDAKAIIVLTDGHETDAKYIADVSSLITDRVYAIGLGTADEVKPSTLNNLVNGSGGYMLMTGSLDINAYFRLVKYYLQILAGITNQYIVLDPEGYVAPGQEHREGFVLNEADISVDVILLSPAPYVFKFVVQAPNGEIIHPGTASILPSVSYVTGCNILCYRMTLPVPVGPAGAGPGTWKVILSINDTMYKRYLNSLDNYPEQYQATLAHGVRYSINAYSYSNLRLEANLWQNSYEPGATLTIRALLTEYGLPVDGRAATKAHLHRPDNSSTIIYLNEVEPGIFESKVQADIPGVYQFRLITTGKTLRNRDFTREQTVTGSVCARGDAPPLTGKDDPTAKDERLCRLLACLLSQNTISRELEARLAEQGLSLVNIRKCLKEFCARLQSKPGIISKIDRGDSIESVILKYPELASIFKLIER